MSVRSDTTTGGDLAKLAFRFVLIIGVVNFFADMTYEGARSIVGPFLGSLGACAAAVGFIAGFGEMVGYGLRSVSGYFADKTHKYWAVAFLGYAINMLAVPALALAGNWPLAAALVVAERTGRAIRRPAVESMLSRAGQSIGQGWVCDTLQTLISEIEIYFLCEECVDWSRERLAGGRLRIVVCA